MQEASSNLFFLGGLFVFIGIPAFVSLAEFIYLVGAFLKKKWRGALAVDLFGLLIAIPGMLLLMDLGNVRTNMDWFEVIHQQDAYTPVVTAHAASVIVFLTAGILSPVVLNLLNGREKTAPPLVFVLLIAFMYIGLAIELAFTIQLSAGVKAKLSEGGWTIRAPGLFAAQLAIFLDILFMDLRTLLRVIVRFRETAPEKKHYGSPVLSFIQDLLFRASLWPALALLFVLPLTGFLIAVLTLFGQAPDALIRAFTETADWRLSEMTEMAPPKVFYDEHYLCTVAAGGHRKIVKPLRKGIRHGHPVVVNRQLEIANAFEQILEEKTPRFHRIVRGIYDRCGFPIARYIRTKTAADIVYIVMKPLEWLFLIVLYLTDTHPENRIAMQYTGKSVRDILKQELCSAEEEKKDLRA